MATVKFIFTLSPSAGKLPSSLGIRLLPISFSPLAHLVGWRWA